MVGEGALGGKGGSGSNVRLGVAVASIGAVSGASVGNVTAGVGVSGGSVG